MRPNPSHGRRSAAVFAAAATLAVAACSSAPAGGSGTQAAATGGAAGGSGSTIKIGVIASVDAAISYPDAPAAAEGAARDLNESGGINGRQIQIVFCNDNFDANQAATCARNLVADGVVATVGDFNAVGQGTVLSTLGAANISSVAEYDGGPAGVDPHSFLFQSSIALHLAAQIDYADKTSKRVALAFTDIPTTEPYFALADKMIPASGGTITAAEKVPDTGDLSAQAASIVNSKPGVTVLATNEAGEALLMKEMDQLGYKGKFVVDSTAVDQTFLDSVGPTIGDQILIVASYPPLNEASKFPGLKRFMADMAAEKAAGDSNAPTEMKFVRDPAISAWLAVYAIAEVANKAKVTTALGIYDALKSVKNLNMMGIIPSWTPGKSVVKSLPRNSNAYQYYYAWNNGNPVMAPDQPTNTAQFLNEFNYQN